MITLTITIRTVNLSVFDDFYGSVFAWRPIVTSVCYRPISLNNVGTGTWWCASTETCRVEIDESELFSPIRRVFLEWDRRRLTTVKDTRGQNEPPLAQCAADPAFLSESAFQLSWLRIEAVRRDMVILNPYDHSPDYFSSFSRFWWLFVERFHCIDRSFLLWEATCSKSWQFQWSIFHSSQFESVLRMSCLSDSKRLEQWRWWTNALIQGGLFH
jgi:hypothetical protein